MKETNGRNNSIQLPKMSRKLNFSLVGYLVLSLISGVAGFLFIALINKVISDLISPNHKVDEVFYIIGFICLIMILFISSRLLAGGIVTLSQRVFWGGRVEVVKLLMNAPYEKVKELKDDIYSTLTNDVGNISQASMVIIDFVTSIVLIICSMGYLFILSPGLFGVSVIMILMSVGIYKLMSRKSTKQFNKSRRLEDRFMGAFNAFLNGAKEIQMDPVKGREIFEEKVQVISKDAFSNNRKAHIGFLNGQLMGQVIFYLMIVVILIYIGKMVGCSVQTSINYTFVLLYILGPIATVVHGIPTLIKARISFNHLKRIKKTLEQSIDSKVRIYSKTKIEFEELEYKNLAYDYPNGDFSIGPVDLILKKGESTFIYGGNGSGKTTLVNSLLSLFSNVKGDIFLDGIRLEGKNRDELKRSFAVVFSDFYLFDEFYGNKNFNKAEAVEYLKLFEMETKVQITDNGFSTTDLSTGQRKRLALIAAALEEKPIIVLDEWAADQSPQFRKKFYAEIVPFIQSKGKTILAITHDDAYYHCSDHLFKMEHGQVEKVNPKATKQVDYEA